VYAAWLALTWTHHAIPWPILFVLGGLVVAAHGSLQHETIHGHPTGSRRLNAALGFPPLALWLPYSIYRSTHLRHHRSDLTDPLDDPESLYVDDTAFSSLPAWRRLAMWVQRTLLGRLVVGPLCTVSRFFSAEVQLVRTGQRPLRVWLVHLAAVAAIIAWTAGICGMSVWKYLLCFVYPGIALTLMRSFAEHRPAADVEHRSAIVEASHLWSLVFLNNNFHAIHHTHPQLPWYALRSHYAAHREEILERNGRFVVRGYGSVLRHHGFVPKDPPYRSPS
jgi:fatty acid desaturase